MTDVSALPAGETVQMECYETDDGLVVQTVGAIDEWMESSEWMMDPDAVPEEDKRWEAVEAELGESR